MKVLIFRLTFITIAIFTTMIQIEIKSLDTLMTTISIVTFFIWVVDLLSHDMSYDEPWHRTRYGSITWAIWGEKESKKDKKINL